MIGDHQFNYGAAPAPATRRNVVQAWIVEADIYRINPELRTETDRQRRDQLCALLARKERDCERLKMAGPQPW